MDGHDHWEWATLWSSNSTLEFLDVVSNMKRPPSGIHRIFRDFGESRIYCDSNTIRLVKD